MQILPRGTELQADCLAMSCLQLHVSKCCFRIYCEAKHYGDVLCKWLLVYPDCSKLNPSASTSAISLHWYPGSSKEKKPFIKIGQIRSLKADRLSSCSLWLHVPDWLVDGAAGATENDAYRSEDWNHMVSCTPLTRHDIQCLQEVLVSSCQLWRWEVSAMARKSLQYLGYLLWGTTRRWKVIGVASI